MPSLQVSVPGQRRDVDDRAGAGLGQADRLELRRRASGSSASLHPAEHDVLLDRGAHVVAARSVRAMSASARIWSAVRSPSGSVTVATDVAGLALRVDVRRCPRVEALGPSGRCRAASPASQRLLLRTRAISSKYASSAGPGAARRAPRATRRRNSSMPSFGDQELQARAVAVLLLAEAREDARRSACAIGSSSSSGRNSSNSFAWCGTAPRPPPT